MKRLDLTALLNLVDEKTLRDHLNRNAYFVHSEIYDDDSNGMQFQVEGSPIEYLIFNSSEFLKQIAFMLPLDDWFNEEENFLLDDVFSRRICPQSDDPADQKRYEEAAELVWSRVKNLTRQELYQYIDESAESLNIHLYYLGAEVEMEDGKIISPNVLKHTYNKGKVIGGNIKIGELTGPKYAEAVRKSEEMEDLCNETDCGEEQ